MLDVLTQAGYSNTRARRAVLEALYGTGGRASPAELLEAGRAYHAALGQVTVYRTLEILVSLGLVRKLHLDEGCHLYALSLTGVQRETRSAVPMPAHSHHIICQRCSRVVEFAGCDLATVIASVEAQTRYRVREHWLEMFGLCPECQDAGDTETRRWGDLGNE